MGEQLSPVAGLGKADRKIRGEDAGRGWREFRTEKHHTGWEASEPGRKEDLEVMEKATGVLVRCGKGRE